MFNNRKNRELRMRLQFYVDALQAKISIMETMPGADKMYSLIVIKQMIADLKEMLTKTK